MYQEVSTLTDLHNTSDQSEVELITLVNKELPKYKLRAESALGYSQEDWIQTPLLPVEVDGDLSPQQCAEILRLFVLSGDRLSQMTRTYHDVKAVTDLLSEKEKDLELAARIGQTLLSKNQTLSEQKDALEERLAEALEEASQLRYEIGQKETLLHIYADDDALSSHSPSPTKDFRLLGRHNGEGQVDILQEKIKRLEERNMMLMQEQQDLEEETDCLDDKEGSLISDTVKQLTSLQEELRSANDQIADVTDELARRNDEAVRQQEEIDDLLTHIVKLQKKYKSLTCEHEVLQEDLNSANVSQLELTVVVQNLESKYNEVVQLLDETRRETRRLTEGGLRSRDGYDVEAGGDWQVPFHHSLAAEIENSGAGLEECDAFFGEEGTPRESKSKSRERLLETVRIANKVKSAGSSHVKRSKSCGRIKENDVSVERAPGRKTPPMPILLENSTKTPSMGKPGVPGTDDLEQAIKTLSFEGISSRRLKERMQAAATGDASCHIPRSSRIRKRCQSAPKLRIVKPLEGSVTLQHWKHLAENHPPFSDLSSVTESAGIVVRSRETCWPDAGARNLSSTPKPTCAHAATTTLPPSFSCDLEECESFDDEGITFTAKACEDLHHVTPTYEPRDTSGDKSRDTPTHSKKVEVGETNYKGITGLKAYSNSETRKSNAGLCNSDLYRDTAPLSSSSVLPKVAQSSPNLYGLASRDLSAAKDIPNVRTPDVPEDWEFLHGSPCTVALDPVGAGFSDARPPQADGDRRRTPHKTPFSGM